MGKLLRAWNLTEKFLVGLLSFLATVITFYGVIMRYLFNRAPEWAEEIVIYLIIWSVFIVASTLSEERAHVGATFVIERFPPKVLRLLEIVTGFLALCFCVLISYWGYQIVGVSFLTDERSLTSLRLPLWIAYCAIPVGGTLIAARYIKRLYRLLFHFDPSDLLGTHEMSRASQLQQSTQGSLK